MTSVVILPLDWDLKKNETPIRKCDQWNSEGLDNTRVVSKVSFPIFFSLFCELINMKLQGDIIFEFFATL